MTLQNNQTTEPVFYWELKVADDIVHVTDKQMTQILDAEARGVKLIKIGEKIINPAFIKSSKKIYKEDPKYVSDMLDWASMDTSSVYSNSKATENREKMMEDIRTMLKERKFNDPKPKIKDEKHEMAIADVWEHLKSVLSTLEYPVKDFSWKLDYSITKHHEGKDSHPVEFMTKKIDLGDKYDEKFWAEASFIFCPACKKELSKQIVVYNDYQGECLVRNL